MERAATRRPRASFGARRTGSARRRTGRTTVDLIFTNPVLTSRLVVDRLGVTVPGAHALLRQVEEIKAVRALPRGRGIEGRWYADDVLAALEP